MPTIADRSSAPSAGLRLRPARRAPSLRAALALALPLLAAGLLLPACDNGPEVAATLELDAPTTNLLVGQSVQITPTVKGKSGKVLTGRPIVYQSSAPGIAGVSADGTLTALSAGSAVITATVDGVTARLDVVVVPVPVNRVALSRDTLTIAAAGTQQLTATPLDSAGHTLFDRVVTWASADTTIARVSSTGLVTGVAAGSTTITATIEGKVGQVHVTVTPPAIATIDISPRTPVVNEGLTVKFTATPRDALGREILGRTLIWTSSDVNIARVDSTGLATAVGPGIANILVTSGTVFGGTTLTVRAVVVGSVTVSPDTATLLVGDSVRLTATVKDTAGNTLTTKPATWRSTDTTVATVSSTGIVHAIANGTAYVIAARDSKADSARIQVTPPPVASITLSPAPANLGLGRSGRLAVTLRDAAGNIITGRAITYTSSSPSIASVDTSGLLAGNALGSSNLTVRSGTRSAATLVSVVATTVASVTTDSTALHLNVGATTTIVAVPRDGANNPLAGRTLAFVSSDTAKVTVSNTGTIKAVAAGTATVTITSEGQSVGVTVTVATP